MTCDRRSGSVRVEPRVPPERVGGPRELHRGRLPEQLQVGHRPGRRRTLHALLHGTLAVGLAQILKSPMRLFSQNETNMLLQLSGQSEKLRRGGTKCISHMQHVPYSWQSWALWRGVRSNKGRRRGRCRQMSPPTTTPLRWSSSCRRSCPCFARCPGCRRGGGSSCSCSASACSRRRSRVVVGTKRGIDKVLSI